MPTDSERISALENTLERLEDNVTKTSCDLQEIRNFISAIKIATPIIVAGFGAAAAYLNFNISETSQTLAAVKNDVITTKREVTEITAEPEKTLSKLLSRKKEELDNYAKLTVTWTPLDSPINLGSLPFETNNEVVYSTKTKLPPNAREVLLLVNVFSGKIKGNELARFNIYTKKGDKKYTHSINWYQFEQQAIGFNSSTMWLPLTEEGQIYAKLTGTPRPEIKTVGGGSIEILGYR